MAAVGGTAKDATITSTITWPTTSVASTFTATTTTPLTTTTTSTEAQLNAVLILHGSVESETKIKALATDIAGNVARVNLTNEDGASSNSFCSLTFQNEMFIYGQVLMNIHVSCYSI